MSAMPSQKYRPLDPIALPDRRWPDRQLLAPPTWVSVDLRDGNQALVRPMDPTRKERMFRLLRGIGFDQIEVGFPSASAADFTFVRHLINSGMAEETTLVVLTQAREDLIRRTFEALEGAPRAIVHFYNSTNEAQRRLVFRTDQAGVKAIAVRAAGLCMDLAAGLEGTDLRFQYSPETFIATEPEFALEVCDAVSDVIGPTAERRLIVNLPATVEMSTPNLYADRVEWMSRHLAHREALELSIHPHNDRGCAVAACELGILAGAERVEGTLFGNGERTGNVDLVTVALNLHSQGVDPGLDLSDIDRVRRTAEECTELPVHPRHPYAGDLVFTAFSGSHQDAIEKGMLARRRQVDPDLWEVPYLPIDPADLGRSYEAIIRVNSQSGKGGVRWVLGTAHGLEPPRGLMVEFGRMIQALADREDAEISPEAIWAAFRSTYIAPPTTPTLSEAVVAPGEVRAMLGSEGLETAISGCGDGPVEAFVAALSAHAGAGLRVVELAEHSLGPGSDALAVAYVQLEVEDGAFWGVGMDRSVAIAPMRAVLAAWARSRASEG